MSNSRKFTIVQKIIAFIKGGDESKIVSFLEMIERQSKNDVKKLKMNLVRLEQDHDVALQEIDDKITDTQLRVSEAYFNIDVEKIQTKESQKTYMEVYMRNISQEENELQRLIESREKAIESYNDKKKSYNEQITKIEARVAKILQEEGNSNE